VHSPHKILFVTYGLPYPPDRGAPIRDFNLIRRVAQRFPVRVLSLVEAPPPVSSIEALRAFCQEVDWVVAKPGPIVPTLWKTLRAFRQGCPLAAASFHHPALAAKIREICTRDAIALVQIEHSFLAPYVRDIPSSGIKRVLSFHNIGGWQYRTMLRMAVPLHEKLLYGAKWLLMQRWEGQWAARFDHCMVVSERERAYLHDSAPSLSATVIDNGVDTGQYRPLPQAAGSHQLLLVGNLHYRPNVDAVVYFRDELLPLIQAEIPDVRLLVVGDCPPEKLRGLAGPAIQLAGHLVSVLPAYGESALCIVPLRAGGGTRLKILEAMALGRPVVSTSAGCEGLAVSHGEHLLVGDTPQAFADHVVALLRDPTRAQQLARQARALAEDRYSWDAIAEKLLSLYEQMLGKTRGLDP
jgi:glycosyltransferase involved in cell wall biosynthesis